MFPEDRVLVGVMPDPRDLTIAHEQHWYRVPVKHAPTGIHAEMVAFYFTKKFGADLQHAIHFYARRTGHELVRRVDLFPDEADHPRAQDEYYMLQLGTIRQKEPPIRSVRWRRITFIQTTWDRFVKAREVNDLFVTGGEFVDRLYHVLKDRGIQPERAVEVHEQGETYLVDLTIPCRYGTVILSLQGPHPAKAIPLAGDEQTDLNAISAAIEGKGGPLMVDIPL